MLYDISAGRTLQSFRLHQEDCRSVRFSPDSKYLLTGSYDTDVSLLHTEGDLELTVPLHYKVAGHKDKVIQSRWHPNRYSFLSSSADRTAVVWSTSVNRNLLFSWLCLTVANILRLKQVGSRSCTLDVIFNGQLWQDIVWSRTFGSINSQRMTFDGLTIHLGPGTFWPITFWLKTVLPIKIWLRLFHKSPLTFDGLNYHLWTRDCWTLWTFDSRPVYRLQLDIYHVWTKWTTTVLYDKGNGIRNTQNNSIRQRPWINFAWNWFPSKT